MDRFNRLPPRSDAARCAKNCCVSVIHAAASTSQNEVHELSSTSVLEVLRIRFLLDPAPEPLPKELELLGSGSLLELDQPMELALFGFAHL